MTLFAASIAGFFPIIHLGRPWFFYWLVPYPATMRVWPQWRSPLVWDFFAIGTYITVSLLFWYMGLIPDLGTLRDRAKSRTVRRIFTAPSRSAGAARPCIGRGTDARICCSPRSRRRSSCRCTA